MILDRVAAAGFAIERANIECLGAGDGVPGVNAPYGTHSVPYPDLRPPISDLRSPPREVVLRVAVHDSRREAVERFAAEFAPLITSGPPGLAGYASGRSPVRPVFAYWPTLMPRDLIKCNVEVRDAAKWASE